MKRKIALLMTTMPIKSPNGQDLQVEMTRYSNTIHLIHNNRSKQESRPILPVFKQPTTLSLYRYMS
uniref:Uncharacterized protein n=1 Tax=Arundo donax TaxID=35708 RepID=A0A0A9B150_ARUDO